jgi:hypothetical protein
MVLVEWDGVFKASDLAWICGAVALCCVISWPFATSYRKAVGLQSVGAAAFAFQFAFLGAWTAAATSTLSLAQLLSIAYVGHRRCTFAVCILSIFALTLISLMTWQGVPSLLAICGSLAGLLARIQRSTTRMKLIFVIGAPFWVVHNLTVGAVFALCIDVVSITGNISSLLRTARRSEQVFLELIRIVSRAFQLPPTADIASTLAGTSRFSYA